MALSKPAQVLSSRIPKAPVLVGFGSFKQESVPLRQSAAPIAKRFFSFIAFSMAGCIFHPIHSPESNATLYTAAQRSVRLRENSVTHARNCIQQHLQSIPIVSRSCLPEASTPRSIVSSTGVLRFQYIFFKRFSWLLQPYHKILIVGLE